MDRKRRADSFFGLHFDFHANPAVPGACALGGRTTERSIADMIQAVRPDYLQCDCKGHPGWSSYPTKAGLAYPDIAGDPLKVWRDATARMGVALYVHYSGVVDTQMCRLHPDWARVTPEQVTDKWATSTFGPYVDELLIPQLMELAGEYGVDGAWVDGECWGTQADYGVRALERFREEAGVDLTLNPPVKRDDRSFQDYCDFCREQFRKYLRHYVDTVHSHHPGFQIASSWAFSSMMPEKVTAGVDFISGDFPPQDSVNDARFRGRYLAGQGLPWDLMAWGFTISDWQGGDTVEKCEAQLKQEAAVVMALGGGFQIYNKQRLDGSISPEQIEALAGVARFTRERQSWCHKAQSVPQALMLYSTADHYRESEYLFSEEKTGSISGMTQLLCDTQHSFKIQSEHGLTGRMGRWPLIVVPETQYLEEGFRRELLEYARGGGSLLLAGPGAVGLFAGELGIELAPCEGVRYLSADGQTWVPCHGPVSGWAASAECDEIGYCGTQPDGDGGRSTAACVYPYGKGKIACLPADVGLSYKSCKAKASRALLREVLGALYKPMVTVEGSTHVDVTVLGRDGQLLIQLVNTAGPHDCANWRSIDEIPSAGPLRVSVRLDYRPGDVRLVPSNQSLAGEWVDGLYRVTVDRLEIHEILAITPA